MKPVGVSVDVPVIVGVIDGVALDKIRGVSGAGG